MNLLSLAREPTLLDRAWMAIQYPWDLVRNPIQAVLSIPTLSFLVIPAFSSYGTTLNLLFFTLTWAILIKTNDPLHVEILGTLGIRLLFYILPSLGFLAFDGVAPSLAVKIKERGPTALPMSVENGGQKGRWWRVALISLGNVSLGIAIQAGVELLFTQVLHLQSVLKLSTGLPMPWGIFKDLFFGLFFREGITYVFHRYGLHSELSPLAKLHANWQHTIPAPFSLVAHYDHPITYLVHVFLPTYLPSVLFRFHLLTYLLYLAIISLEETFAYSGYNMLPSAFVLGGIARRQERHLIGPANGNYGCFGLVDLFCGTSIGEDLMDDVIDEAEEEQVVKKTKQKMKAAGNKVLRNKPEENEDAGEHGEQEEEGGRQRGSAEREDDEEEVGATFPKPKGKGGSPKSGKNVVDTHEEDRPNEISDEQNQRPPKRPSRTRRGEKKSSEEDTEARGPDEEANADEKSKPKARVMTKKGNLKGKSRPRKPSQDNDE